MKEHRNTGFWVFWIAGFLFTIGYCILPAEYYTTSWVVKIIFWILVYFLWPFALGYEFSGK